MAFWLVVSTHLKSVSQIGSFPQVGVKIKNIWNHHQVFIDPLEVANYEHLGVSCVLNASNVGRVH